MKCRIKTVGELLKTKNTYLEDGNVHHTGSGAYVNRRMQRNYCGKIVILKERDDGVMVQVTSYDKIVWESWMYEVVKEYNRNGANS